MKHLLYILIILSVSCKSKHKVIDRQKEITKTEEQKSVNTLTQNDIVIDSIAKKGSSVISIKSIKSIELTQSDSDKNITITDNKGNSLSITGANAMITTSETTETKQDSSNVKKTKTDKSNSNNTTNTNSDNYSKKVHRNSNSDVKTTSTWFWIGLIIFGSLIIYLRFKK